MMPWLPPLALALDLCFADPKTLPHPVQGIGKLAETIEPYARRLGKRMGGPTPAGALAVLLLIMLSGGAVAVLIRLPFGIGVLAAVYCAWSGLALGGLIRAGEAALDSVQKAEADASFLPEARAAVQMLVSRDCAAMPVQDLYRSLAESVSENCNDAFVAPYFWLCLGGPVALWVYKTVSTLDSMWGYTTERWRCFGRAAARLDDVLAYVPARLTALLMYLAARSEQRPLFAAGNGVRSLPPAGQPCSPARSGWPGWQAVARQARQSASPNAGWPMAAAAWLFSGKTGGPTVYDGQVRHKPLMGPESGNWNAANTLLLIRHVRRTGIIGGLLGAGVNAAAALLF